MEGPSQTEPSATQVIGRVLPAADDALVDADAALPPNLGRWLGPIHGHPTRAGPAGRPASTRQRASPGDTGIPGSGCPHNAAQLLGHPSGRTGRCLLYTSDAADDLLCVDLGGRRII